MTFCTGIRVDSGLIALADDLTVACDWWGAELERALQA
jgi:hypothetical protein